MESLGFEELQGHRINSKVYQTHNKTHQLSPLILHGQSILHNQFVKNRVKIRFTAILCFTP